MAAANSEKIDKTGMVGEDGDGGEGFQFQFGTCHRHNTYIHDLSKLLSPSLSHSLQTSQFKIESWPLNREVTTTHLGLQSAAGGPFGLQ